MMKKQILLIFPMYIINKDSYNVEQVSDRNDKHSVLINCLFYCCTSGELYLLSTSNPRTSSDVGQVF